MCERVSLLMTQQLVATQRKGECRNDEEWNAESLFLDALFRLEFDQSDGTKLKGDNVFVIILKVT